MEFKRREEVVAWCRDEEGEECVSSGIDEEIIIKSEQDLDAPDLNGRYLKKQGEKRGTGKEASKNEINCSRLGDSSGRFGILSKRVAGERKAPVKKRKAAKEEDFEEQNSTACPACEYRDGDRNKVSKKQSRQNIGEGAKLFLDRNLQNDPLDNRQFLSAPSMGCGSSSISNSELKKREFGKWQKAGEDLDGNERWTDESLKFLVETCAPLHMQQVGEQSNGHVKYQKKWTSILQAMQQRFGIHFTKKECQSKYWCASREWADYRYSSSKIHQRDLSRNPSVAGRELLKPKFYDVWYETAEKVHVLEPSCGTQDSMREEEGLNGQGVLKLPNTELTLRCLGMEEMSSKHQMQDCTNSMREIQQLMQTHLQASEKREEAIKYHTEFMMQLLTQHVEHVEKTVSNFEQSQQPQHDLLEHINEKLEKVLDGFTTLNNHLSTLTSQISKTLETPSSG